MQRVRMKDQVCVCVSETEGTVGKVTQSVREGPGSLAPLHSGAHRGWKHRGRHGGAQEISSEVIVEII